jgi:hypothetical protein
MAYNWLYTSWNDNEYILFLIIIILFFIIIDFKLLSRKKSNFFNLPNGNTKPATTIYQAPTATNPANNLYVSPEEKEKWRRSWVQLDGNEESLAYSSNTAIRNDILNLDSTMYVPNYTSNSSVKPVNYAEQADWATIDDLGKSLTDTLGGINSNLGYVLLDEKLGTFKPNYNNPNTYDNTQNYKTGMNPNAVDGAQLQGAGGSYQQLGKSPIFMQKDFAGVANIFAPNIYVSNPPLGDDGFGGISLSSGDGNVYSV